MSSISFFDEFLEAEKAGIRLRYGKHYEAGAFLARLDFIGQIYKFDPALAAEKMKGYALLVGMNVLIDALARETTFIDDLVGAIGEDQKDSLGSRLMMWLIMMPSSKFSELCLRLVPTGT